MIIGILFKKKQKPNLKERLVMYEDIINERANLIKSSVPKILTSTKYHS